MSPLIQEFFNQHQFDLIIPIPISSTRKFTRTFNQCEQLLKQAKVTYHSILASHFREHQYNLTKQERHHLPSPFYKVFDELINEQMNICLFDDIYTTGQTMRHAIETLNVSVTMVTLAKVTIIQ